MSADYPEHWLIKPLDEVMEAIIDYRGKTPQKTDCGIPLITAKIVKNGRIETPEEFIAESQYSSWMVRGLPRAGDVVVTTEAPLGEIAQLDDSNVALAQRIVTLRGKEGILNNDYLLYLMQSSYVQDQLESRASGSTVKGIKQSELRKILLPIPPEDEQVEIAKHLKALDKKVEVNRQINQSLEQMAQAIFKSWFVDFDPVRAKIAGRQPEGMSATTAVIFPEELMESELGFIPKGWGWSTIGEEVEVLGGGTPSTQEEKFWAGGQFNWATPKDLSGLNDKVLLGTERRVTQAGLDKISSGLLPINVVLMSSRAPVGYLAIAKVPVAINQGFIAMRCEKILPPEYVLQWTSFSINDIKLRASGTTFAEISKKTFRPIPVLVPEGEVLSEFCRVVAPLYEKIALLAEESRSLAVARSALLPKLFSGQMKV
ncbi:restriction endonuclease subunit S [Pseudomonas sp.]|uniref:restriction endonuclease subunit S n=1 Tax=Pseudomonas sp. TaxID=306 RepID=UPI003981988A